MKSENQSDLSRLPQEASEWRVSLTELSEACRVLAQHLDLQDESNRRVQWDLPPRLIRYYTTLGLLDREREKRGKYKLYSARHLFQILAVKKLQSEGLSLAEIQGRLLGSSDEEMVEYLKVPKGWLELVREHQLQPPPPPAPPTPDRSSDFWMQPAPLPDPSTPATNTEVFHRVRLANGLEICIPAEVWEQTDPQDWMNWLAQAPE